MPRRPAARPKRIVVPSMSDLNPPGYEEQAIDYYPLQAFLERCRTTDQLELLARMTCYADDGGHFFLVLQLINPRFARYLRDTDFGREVRRCVERHYTQRRREVQYENYVGPTPTLHRARITEMRGRLEQTRVFSVQCDREGHPVSAEIELFSPSALRRNECGGLTLKEMRANVFIDTDGFTFTEVFHDGERVGTFRRKNGSPHWDRRGTGSMARSENAVVRRPSHAEFRHIYDTLVRIAAAGPDCGAEFYFGGDPLAVNSYRFV